MESRRFGGATAPVIGMGTWMMEQDSRAAVETLRRGIAEGATHVDTAEMYGAGEVERIVGRAIRGLREKVFLVSKVLPSNATFDGTLRACERSLDRLATDHLDCYLLHWREPSVVLEETFHAFDKLIRDGKIRSFGVSNFDVGDLEEAVAIVGEQRIACNQIFYHVEERAAEQAVIPWCAAHGVAVVAYSPYGQGKFPSPSSNGGKVLQEIATVRKVTPRQVALAFLLRRPHVVTIPKTSKIPHLLENIAAAGLTLTEDDVRRIDAAFPVGKPRPLPMI